MINILLKGVDDFLGADVEKAMSTQIAKILKVNEDEVMFTCFRSMIFHGGVDQTSCVMHITVELSTEFKIHEEELANYILKASQNFAIHCYLNFEYFSGKMYSRINPNYPKFISKSEKELLEENEEDDEESYEYTEEELFTGNIFAEFDKEIAEIEKKSK